MDLDFPGKVKVCVLNYSNSSYALPISCSLTHDFSKSPYPFHLTKNSQRFLTNLLSTICSISYSDWPSTSIGYSKYTSPWVGFNYETWNTLCMFHVGGNSSWYATVPIYLKMTNGPAHRASSFLVFYLSGKYFVANQTF